jgi:hypothetical protein
MTCAVNRNNIPTLNPSPPLYYQSPLQPQKNQSNNNSNVGRDNLLWTPPGSQCNSRCQQGHSPNLSCCVFLPTEKITHYHGDKSPPAANNDKHRDTHIVPQRSIIQQTTHKEHRNNSDPPRQRNLTPFKEQGALQVDVPW